MTIYNYVDSEGISQGSFNFEVDIPAYFEVPNAPISQFQKWDFEAEKWIGQETDLSQRYGQFRMAMLTSSGWQAIKGDANQFVPEFMGAIAYMDDNPGVVKQIWNALINLEIQKETMQQSFALEWKAIVEAVGIGIEWIGDRELAFDFDDNGFML